VKSQSQIHIKKSQRGYSLIELSIVLAIIAVIIAGAVFGVQAILRANNVNRTISQTNTAANKIVAKLIRDTNYANATTQNLTRLGQDVWDTQYVSAGLVENPFNGSVFVAPLSAAEGGLNPNEGYVYTLTGLPVTVCSDVAAGIEGLGTALRIANEAGNAATAIARTVVIGAAGGGTLIKDTNANTPYSFSSAAAACAGGVGPAQQASVWFLVPRR
jgi:prepilin-type N-terminal cleavage/methylation domain-containing protein